MKQRDHVTQMRSLLFRHVMKQKRIKKIKSKTYHRLKNKDKLKVESAEMLMDPKAAKEQARKQEFKRAEERLTLKHKNKSKWAKRILEGVSNAQDEGTHALLTRKIDTVKDSSSSSDSSSDDNDEGSNEDRASELLGKAKDKTMKVLEDDEELPNSGFFSYIRHPEVKWAQRTDKVFITVLLPDSKNAKVNLEPEGVFNFSATAGTDNNTYELKLDLFDKVNVEESKINVGVRSIFCILEKAEKVWWKKLLRGDGKAPHYVKVDWDKWVDEDEDKGLGDLDLGGMDFSNFGGMGGMGDMMGGMGDMMGGMGGMGGMDEFEDSDDEGQEVTKPDDKAEGDAKPDEHGIGSSEKKEAEPST
ncbi:hypothetical protein CXB51_032157 [Gossypium anomalum]|uniref:Co-chaperone protein p23 n=1 Tax=Gossypium anomalum TaxID=47600 RepID=A0A8J5YRT5_9ROSI|nr:hypothetical protein CXB51_032157 [Gossypium anomalum]